MTQDELRRLYLHCEIRVPKQREKFTDEGNGSRIHSLPEASKEIISIAFLASRVAVANFKFGELIPPF